MADDYRELAAKCRSLAERITDPRTVDVLLKLAEEYEEKAKAGPAAITPITPDDISPRPDDDLQPRPEPDPGN